MSHFDLFIDESGSLQEDVQNGVFQIVAVFASHGEISESAADELIDYCVRRAGITAVIEQMRNVRNLPPGTHIHATELNSYNSNAYNRLLDVLVPEIQNKGWRAARVTNRERLTFGGKIATYTNMFAELVTRFFHTVHISTNEKLVLDLLYEGVQVGGETGQIPRFDYENRLKEYIARTMVRRGLAGNVSLCSLNKLRCCGKADPRINLADFLSHASFRNFRAVRNENTRNILRSLFRDHDYTLYQSDKLDNIQQAIDNRFFTLALQQICYLRNLPELSREHKSKLNELPARIRTKLLLLSPEERNAQLRQIEEWVKQLVVARLSLSKMMEDIDWLVDTLAQRLAEKCEKGNDYSTDWFRLALYTRGLEVANHMGNPLLGRRFSDNIDKMYSRLAGRWEYASYILEAMVFQAVHLTDCFETDEAVRRMSAVDGFYSNLADSFHKALPGVFPETVLSDTRARALGTMLQAQIHKALSEPGQFDVARRNNDEAVRQFESEHDKRRQYQYRCELEAYAGDFDTARSFLAMVFGLPQSSNSHQQIAYSIQPLPADARLFPLLHWSRIGAQAAREGADGELGAFRDAYLQNNFPLRSLQGSDWQQYPAPALGRFLAIAFAGENCRAEVLNLAQSLLTYPPGTDPLLKLLSIAGWLEVLTFVSSSDLVPMTMGSGKVAEELGHLYQETNGILQNFADKCLVLKGFVENRSFKDDGKKIRDFTRALGY